MESPRPALDSIGKDIEEILFPFLKVNSETGTQGEKECEAFLMETLRKMPYFKRNPDNCGTFPVKDDARGRAVCWGLAKGGGTETVILLHHYDIVGVEDFKNLKNLAFSPELLRTELMKIAAELQPEAQEDLRSGEYLFGRGTADMKAGGSIQLALLRKYSDLEAWNGNLLLLALPDEENLSAGMRSAVDFLAELKEKHGLHYVCAFNSEPHQRKTPERTLLSEGSVGKMLAFVYVRGSLAHCGKVFEGLNPLSVLSEMAVRTELSPRFSDSVQGESSPPPTWLYLRDRKDHYDVSMPLSAAGCVSILTLDSDPLKVLELLSETARQSFETVIDRMNERYRSFCAGMGREAERLPWNPSITTYSTLLAEADRTHGSVFRDACREKVKEVQSRIDSGSADLIESSFQLVEFVYNYINDLSPKVVLGFVPPYYPNVANGLLPNLPAGIKGLSETLSAYSEKNFGSVCDRESYYTGISDLSYVAFRNSGEIGEELRKNMPLYGNAYSIPLTAIESLSMPCMNIGPWGKDFHKLTERVYKPDLFDRTPKLLAKAIDIVLEI
jgi:arginine utilization protein RocB